MIMPDASAPTPAPPVEEVAIKLQGVKKIYPLHKTLTQAALEYLGFTRLIPRPFRPQYPTHAAVNGVDLEVNRGQRVGIVGQNGAGKTTLLKLISQNFAPTHGTICVRGRINAIMTTGLGFSPEITGYRNIVSALEYNGLSKTALQAAIEDVIDFCELGDYLHQPFKNYSLGMMSRLQFACATAINPDILIIDEVLGAGDSYFTAKSADRVKRLAKAGCTLLLVSHSMAQIIEFCDRVIWMRNGQIYQDGETVGVIGAYEVFMSRRVQHSLSKEEGGAATNDGRVLLSDGKAVFRWASELGPKFSRLAMLVDGMPVETATSDSSIRFECDLVSDFPGTFSCTYFIHFWRRDGLRAARLEAPIDHFVLQEGETRKIAVEMPPGAIAAGTYLVSFSIYDRSYGKDTVSEDYCRFDLIDRAIKLDVTYLGACESITVQPTEWHFGASQP